MFRYLWNTLKLRPEFSKSRKRPSLRSRQTTLRGIEGLETRQMMTAAPTYSGVSAADIETSARPTLIPFVSRNDPGHGPPSL